MCVGGGCCKGRPPNPKPYIVVSTFFPLSLYNLNITLIFYLLKGDYIFQWLGVRLGGFGFEVLRRQHKARLGFRVQGLGFRVQGLGLRV